MQLTFSKMHGIGNEFMMIDASSHHLALSAKQIQAWSKHDTGIGFDQLIMLIASNESSDFALRIFNADGSEAEQCGNGVRCAAQFARYSGLSNNDSLRIQIGKGEGKRIVVADILSAHLVRVDMGEPVFEPQLIPFLNDTQSDRYYLDIGGDAKDRQLECGVVSMGNPHAVIQVENLIQYPVDETAARVQAQAVFTEGVNVSFMQIVDSNNIQLRVFERGVGETAACGSGACAAVVIGRQWGLLDRQTHVQLSGGQLDIEWQGLGWNVCMTGETVFMYDGDINYDE